MQDKFSIRARKEGLRARSAYKLLQINNQYHIIKPGDSVLDLGCWPGGWLVVAKKTNASIIVGIDLVDIEKIDGVEFIKGDINKEKTYENIIGKFDVVLSDLAPKTTGDNVLDVYRSVDLAKTALKIAKKFLKPKGIFLVKIFQGEGYNEYISSLKKYFSIVKTIKPLASKTKSREMYILGFR